MADVICKNCNEQFDPTNYRVNGAAGLSGAAAGALIGSRIGLALGPYGAIAGTIPGAIIGGIFGSTASSKITKCPCCGSIMAI